MTSLPAGQERVRAADPRSRRSAPSTFCTSAAGSGLSARKRMVPLEVSYGSSSSW
jgi:hypothetical protein